MAEEKIKKETKSTKGTNIKKETKEVVKKPVRKKVVEEKKKVEEKKPIEEKKTVEVKKKVEEKKIVEKVNIEEKKPVNEVKQDNKKTKEGFSFAEVIILLIIVLLVGVFCGSYFTYKKFSNENVDCSSIDKESAEIINVYNDLLNNYYGGVSKETLADNAIKGMVYSMGDKYAAFFDRTAGDSLDEDLSGSFTGLGVEISGNEKGQIQVVTVFEDSAAAKSGIKVGDIILKLDNASYTSQSLSLLVSEIKSSKVGDVRKLEILRDGKTFEVNVKLETVELTSVYSYFVIRNNKKVGYIQIQNFAANTYNQFLSNYENLSKENIDSLVIDLRGNGGGYLSSAHNILSLFLNKDDVVYQRTDGKNVEEIVNDLDRKIKIPVVLLVNSGTASSSEVFVSSLRENLKVSIVGEKTYGKGTIQKLVSLLNGRYIKFTTQEWLTPSGKKIEGVGIEPTDLIQFSNANGNDNQLEKAFDVAANK